MKNKIAKTISIITMLVCIGALIFSGYKIFDWYISNQANKKIKKKVEESIKVDKKTNKTTVDFKTLKEQNPDTVAYLKVNGTNINYVVVKGKDNDYYLNHNFKKEYNISGWVFADYHNLLDGTDKNIIVYGHNTMDGSMFGSLNNILKKEWYENTDNLEITFITEKEESKYQVFSVYQIEAEDYYINTNFTNNDFNSFINNLKNRSIHDFNVEISPENSILTLSTCSFDGKERVVLHAKK